MIQIFFVKMFKVVKILFFIDEKFKIKSRMSRNLNITNKKQISTMLRTICTCYGQFILLVEYLGMNPDSGRHASDLTAHTVYSLADFQLSNHINYYLFNHTLCLLHYTSAIYPMPDNMVAASHR